MASQYCNGGVSNLLTKKALKEAVATDPSKVVFYNTSDFGPQFSGPVDRLSSPAHQNLVLSVCGPDPYRKRVWYANVRWDRKKNQIVVE